MTLYHTATLAPMLNALLPIKFLMIIIYIPVMIMIQSITSMDITWVVVHVFISLGKISFTDTMSTFISPHLYW